MQFFTSDTHFFHDQLVGVNDFSNRDFIDATDMNEAIIHNWNEKVGPDDTVYHLGDIAMLHTRPSKLADEKIFEVLNQLNGHLILVKGNHDSRELFKYLDRHNYDFGGKPKFEFHDVGVLIKMNHRQYYLTHYPMMLGIVKQIINVHGHLHRYTVPIKENVNVGPDSGDLDYLKDPVPFGAPLSTAELEEIVIQKGIDFAKRR